jgi:hypothetical protein
MLPHMQETVFKSDKIKEQQAEEQSKNLKDFNEIVKDVPDEYAKLN